MSKNRKVLVLEDEQRAGEKLISMLEGIEEKMDIHWCRSVSEGIEFLKNTKDLDVIFSDIELTDGKAFTIYDEVKPNCPIIFCTAYDNFYVSAFKTNGIAYLLKPFSEEELKMVWQKYLLLFSEPKEADNPEELLQSIQSLLSLQPDKYKESFTVKKKDGVFLLKTQNISYFQAQGDFVIAYDFTGSRHILGQSLSAINEALNPKLFFQINRSEIVQKETIEKYSSYTKNRLTVHMKNSEEVLYTSNSRSPEFKSWFEEG